MSGGTIAMVSLNDVYYSTNEHGQELDNLTEVYPKVSVFSAPVLKGREDPN